MVVSTDLIFKTSAGITMYNRMIIKADGRIGVGTTTPTYLFDVAGGDINTSGFYRQGGTPGLSSTTCDPNQVLKGANIRGGIVTGGSCAADDTGVTAEENLKIIRGRVESNGVVYSGNGSGFTVSKEAGYSNYTITFTTPFAGLPTVVASIDSPGATGHTLYLEVISSSQVIIHTRQRSPCYDGDLSGGCSNNYPLRFNFIAVGPR